MMRIISGKHAKERSFGDIGVGNTAITGNIEIEGMDLG